MNPTPLCAWLGRPSVPWLVISALLVIGGWILHVWLERSTRPDVPWAHDDKRPAPFPEGYLEAPAVVGLLTSGFEVPPGAVPGTVLDLAARGWLHTTVSNGQLYLLTESRPPADDGLAGFEQHVVGYISSLSKDGAVSATVLGRRSQMKRAWWNKLRREVAATAQQLGLTTERYRTSSIGSVAALVGLGALGLINALRKSTEVAIADSWLSRSIWLAILIGLIMLAIATYRRITQHAQTPTDLGQQRASEWVGYRSRLDARIPSNASVIGSPNQQRALGDGVAMGVAPMVYKQLPIVRRSFRWAWSTAGGHAHTVRVRYPIRPGYGRKPLLVALVGVVALFATRALRSFLLSIADGSRFGDTVDSIPGGEGVVHPIVGGIAIALFVPILLSLWCIIAGLVDTVISDSLIGVVVRAPTPHQVLDRRLVRLVMPFARRSAHRTYVAVDPGEQVSINAWLTTSSKAAPQGAGVRARVTPLLGYVRSCEPIARSAADDSGSMPRPTANATS